MKKLCLLFAFLFCFIFTINAVVIVPHYHHTHYGELELIDEYYSDDREFVGSLKYFTEQHKIDADTNTAFNSQDDTPVYYKQIVCIYKYSGCGHEETRYSRIRITSKNISEIDAKKWSHKRGINHFYQRYNWETDTVSIDYFGIGILLFSLISIIWFIIILIKNM
jgi:hypothetical protein